MWKVEFTAEGKSVILYIASDALIATAETTLTSEEQYQYFEAQLAKLAFELHRQSTKTDEQQIYYIRSYLTEDENLHQVTLHYYKVGAERSDQMWLRLTGQGKYYTDTLLGTNTGAPIRLAGEKYDSERIPAELTLAQLFDEHPTNMNAWFSRFRGSDKPPIPAAPVAGIPLDEIATNALSVENYLKNNIIIALYNAAREYYCLIWTASKKKPDSIREMIRLFNEKFQGVASISTNLRLSNIDLALSSMQALTLSELETTVNHILSRCRPTDNFLDVLGILDNYGPAFHFAKVQLNNFRAIASKQLGAMPGKDQMVYDEVSEPLETNIGIVTNKLPVVKQVSNVVINTGTFVLEKTGLKDDRKEFSFNPVILGIHDNPLALQQLLPGREDLKRSKEKSDATSPGAAANSEPVASPSRPGVQNSNSSSVGKHPIATEQQDRLPAHQIEEDNDTFFKNFFADLREVQAASNVDTTPKAWLSPNAKRILICAGIAFALAAIAATIVCLTFFSSGLIVAPVVATAAIATIGGLGQTLAAIIGGVIATTLIGAGIGALFNICFDARKKKFGKLATTADQLDTSTLRGSTDADAWKRMQGTTASSNALPSSPSSLPAKNKTNAPAARSAAQQESVIHHREFEEPGDENATTEKAIARTTKIW